MSKRDDDDDDDDNDVLSEIQEEASQTCGQSVTNESMVGLMQ